jgi:hypothetical protein
MTKIDRNFLAELAELKRKADAVANRSTSIKPSDGKVFNLSSGGKKYAIRKRSLPVGIDEIVAYFVTKEEAEVLRTHVSQANNLPLFRTRTLQGATEDSKILIYYDIIPIDATTEEMSVFYNPRPVTIE